MEELNKQLDSMQREKSRKEELVKRQAFLNESRLKAMEDSVVKAKKERDEADLAKKYGEERF